MNMETNKIFAAVLVAGIIAMASGLLSEVLIQPKEIDGAYSVDLTKASAAQSAVPAEPEKLEPIAPLLASADLDRGKKLSKACAACHSFDQGGPNKTGPNLWNIVNSELGSKVGFSYSSALKEKGGRWGVEELNAFLLKPKKYISGTKMNYVGLKKEKDRAAMIAWMKSLK